VSGQFEGIRNGILSQQSDLASNATYNSNPRKTSDAIVTRFSV